MNDQQLLCFTHAAVVSPLAADLEDAWQHLCQGHGAIAPVSRFDTAAYISAVAACVPDLAPPVAGRSLLCSLLDVLTPQLRSWPVAVESTLLFTASAKCGVDVLERQAAGKEAYVADMLPRGMRQRMCEGLGHELFAGEHVSAACASGGAAVIRGAQSILAGRCNQALVVAADLVTAFTMSGFSALRALSPMPCRPFDKGRDGLSLGEGAAALLLMPLSRALELGHAPLALLTGWGLASDARHITAPSRDGRGLVKALQQALCRAGRHQVDAVCAHGTGTVYNDAMELTALEQVFSETPPLFSCKGALGHAMAASAALELALCLRALRDSRLPPTLGCQEPEEQVAGKAMERCQDFAGQTICSCNSGFGGVNTALILEHPAEQAGEQAGERAGEREEKWASI